MSAPQKAADAAREVIAKRFALDRITTEAIVAAVQAAFEAYEQEKSDEEYNARCGDDL